MWHWCGDFSLNIQTICVMKLNGSWWRSAGDVSRHITTHNIKLLWREIQNEWRRLTHHLMVSLDQSCSVYQLAWMGPSSSLSITTSGDGFYQHSNTELANATTKTIMNLSYPIRSQQPAAHPHHFSNWEISSYLICKPSLFLLGWKYKSFRNLNKDNTYLNVLKSAFQRYTLWDWNINSLVFLQLTT